MGRRALIALLALASIGFTARALVAALPSSANRADSPFVALAAGHPGQAYSDTLADIFAGAYPQMVPPLANYRILSATLPAGLSLDPNTGIVSGAPVVPRVSTLRIAATDKNGAGNSYIVRAEVDVISKNASEVVPGQGLAFLNNGPYSVTTRTVNFNYTSSYDSTSYNTNAIIYTPTGATGPLPVVIFHRGRGLNYDDYPTFLTHVASYGIVAVTVADWISFVDYSGNGPPNPTYDGSAAEEGMESASAAQEACMDYLLGLNVTQGDPLYQQLDVDNVFIGGHSRGGGATQGSHTRSLLLRCKGCIYFMAFDLRYFNQTVPPGIAPDYGIPTLQPRLPSLIFAAELDGDLVYPYANEFIDRATGPTTFATVYGAIHDYLADTHPADATATITRAQEQNEIANLVVAFVKRWSNQDQTLDGVLYGNELQSSTVYGIASWRRTSPTVLVDDFQGSNPGLDALGGTKGATGLSYVEQTVYPPLGNLGSLGIQNCICSFNGSANCELDMDLNGARDLTQDRVLLARVMQNGSQGFKLNAWAVLTDAHGNKASVQFAQTAGGSLGYLPAYASGGDAYDRFLTLNIPLVNFERANGTIDLSQVTKVAFTFGVVPNSTPEFVLDDVRFE
jgi:pimeloyl-ACP methyl ester carboxylesterase